MLTKVLLILLGTFVILPSSIEGPYVGSWKGPTASAEDVYDPKPQAPETELPTEEIQPTTVETYDRLGKLPAATHILDSILNNYDYKLRPGIGERPTVVTVELSVNTLGPISILDMEYTIDITFYQTWYDERLRYNGSFESFVLNGNLVSLLWVPDTFFRNSKRTQEHSITMPNQMVRIYKDGKVLYTISFLSCDFMVMTLFFNVSRRFGFVAFQNYVPSSVTTMISWISFWLKKDSAPARTSLGITSVLTMTTLGTFSRKNFPRVSYITALDFYIAICFVFCFCALMEFAVLNFLTYNRTHPRGSPKLRHPRIHVRAPTPPRIPDPESFVCDIEDSEEEEEEESDEEDEGPSCPARQAVRPSRASSPGGCCRWCRRYCCMVPGCDGSSWQQGRLFIHVYRLDNYSRVIFPVTFFFFNVLYWLVCLNL